MCIRDSLWLPLVQLAPSSRFWRQQLCWPETILDRNYVREEQRVHQATYPKYYRDEFTEGGV
eukprot:3571-Amphidinium_carterae.1